MVFFSSPQCPTHLCDPISLLFNGYWELFPAGKVVRHGADNSCLSSTKVKNEWSYISTPLYTCIVCTDTGFLFFNKTQIIQMDFFFITQPKVKFRFSIYAMTTYFQFTIWYQSYHSILYHVSYCKHC